MPSSIGWVIAGKVPKLSPGHRRTRSGPSGAFPFTDSCAPLPEPFGHLWRKPMTELAGHHDDLTPMVRLVGDEVGQDMPDVQAAGCARRRPWNGGTRPPSLQPRASRAAMPRLLRLSAVPQLPASDGPVIHPYWGRDAVLVAQGPDPAASRIVEVGADRPDGAARNFGDGRGPEGGRDVLDEVLRDSAAGAPGRQDRVLQIERWRHGDAPGRVARAARLPHPPGAQPQVNRRKGPGAPCKWKVPAGGSPGSARRSW